MIKLILSALLFNISPYEIDPYDQNAKFTFYGTILVTIISWTYIISDMVLIYKHIDEFYEKLTIIFECIGFAILIIILISSLSLFIFSRELDLKSSLHISILANLPVLMVAVIYLLMSAQFHTVKIMPLFPEHAIILSGFFTIISHARAMTYLNNEKLGLMCMPLMIVLFFILLGPIINSLFHL